MTSIKIVEEPSSVKSHLVVSVISQQEIFFGFLALVLCVAPATVILCVRGQTFQIVVCAACAFVSFFGGVASIPTWASKLSARGICGRDLNKKNNDALIPESLGILPGFFFIMSCIVCQVMFRGDVERLLEYNSGVLSISFMNFLGFIDDVLDLPWRYKMFLPLVEGALPPFYQHVSGGSLVVHR
eukprot:GHVL01031831.1.p1 GENE.GHVL01031831.1~~GHVL01031831.1.p1  ORF type:complete len:185 (+),score=19.23 GHVL01031831.1:24-578(+)